jgi:FdhD protein
MTDARKLGAGIADRSVIRLSAAAPMADGQRQTDRIVVEEPLEIRIAGEPMAVTMRTPGDDRALALGFLFAEGVLEGMHDVGAVVHCGRPGDDGYGNTIDVTPAPGTVLDPERLQHARRGTLTTAACGVCGRRSIEDLLARCGPVPALDALALDVLRHSVDRLEERQPNFERTGGIHAAAVLTAGGDVIAVAEDVGRHNAVDKTLGSLLREGRIGVEAAPLAAERAAILAVSGRVSFEIVQKAAAAGIAAVAGVSAPTSLAVDLAQGVGITLAGFARGGSLNVYAHGERLR